MNQDPPINNIEQRNKDLALQAGLNWLELASNRFEELNWFETGLSSSTFNWFETGLSKQKLV